VGILETGVIWTKSNGVAKHGPGVYLTSVSPDQGKKTILHNNYGVNLSTVKKERANFFFKFESRFLQDAQKVGGGHTRGGYLDP